ncbi:MAG: DUF4363 family protein [Ruminococcus sp.]|nr:DUF4363 family protein [Candidatus Copronaster equi]
MKRVIIAAILVILTIGSSIYVYKTTENRVNDFINIVENEKESVIRTHKPVYKNAEKISEKWKSEQKVFQAFLSHNKTYEIDLCIYNLKDYAKQDNFDEYIETLNECTANLKRIIDTEKLTLSNLF